MTDQAMGLAVGTLKQSSTSLLPLMFDLLVCMTTQVSSQPKSRRHERSNVDRAKVEPAWSPSLKFIVTHLASSTLARSTFKRSCRRKPCKNETSAVILCWLFLNRVFSGKSLFDYIAHWAVIPPRLRLWRYLSTHTHQEVKKQGASLRKLQTLLKVPSNSRYRSSRSLQS